MIMDIVFNFEGLHYNILVVARGLGAVSNPWAKRVDRIKVLTANLIDGRICELDE
jgi:hypothetical protein